MQNIELFTERENEGVRQDTIIVAITLALHNA